MISEWMIRSVVAAVTLCDMWCGQFSYAEMTGCNPPLSVIPTCSQFNSGRSMLENSRKLKAWEFTLPALHTEYCIIFTNLCITGMSCGNGMDVWEWLYTGRMSGYCTLRYYRNLSMLNTGMWDQRGSPKGMQGSWWADSYIWITWAARRSRLWMEKCWSEGAVVKQSLRCKIVCFICCIQTEQNDEIRE